MSVDSKIEWCDATWNPISGCTKVSDGCTHCYAETFAERWRGTRGHHFENGFDLTLRPERLEQPLHWKRPRRIFVNSMSDLFHQAVPDRFIAEVFAVMATARQHTYLVLTKRHGRMRSLLNSNEFRLTAMGLAAARDEYRRSPIFPQSHIWLGVSVEDQHWADIRIPALLDTPAAVRFVSAEPLLGPVDLTYCAGIDALRPDWTGGPGGGMGAPHPLLDWVIAGGESGPGARPCDLAWLRSLALQCERAQIPYFCKQLGSALGRQLGAGSKGGDWSAWPEDLKVRQFPRVAEAVSS